MFSWRQKSLFKNTNCVGNKLASYFQWLTINELLFLNSNLQISTQTIRVKPIFQYHYWLCLKMILLILLPLETKGSFEYSKDSQEDLYSTDWGGRYFNSKFLKYDHVGYDEFQIYLLIVFGFLQHSICCRDFHGYNFLFSCRRLFI